MVLVVANQISFSILGVTPEAWVATMTLYIRFLATVLQWGGAPLAWWGVFLHAWDDW